MENDIIDELQIQEWVDSIDNVIDFESKEVASFIIKKIINRFNEKTGTGLISDTGSINTPYVNTIPSESELQYPGNKKLESKIAAIIRWNATAMVLKANKDSSELGGHIASYASIASLYEVGFNHFWHSPHNEKYGDFVYFQGHSSPGVYSRSFLENRFTEEQLIHFRQEAFNNGLSSYPHPWLMPEYWQFPTVSMGLGPLMAIHQARFMKYLLDRELIKDYGRKIWCFIGDGETSEPETLGNIHLASRDKLDNLIFIINCNLQRLDGPVNGNGKIIQEMESLFKGANWNVIKIIWGHGWDQLFAKDTNGKLKSLMMETVDGEYQTYRAKNGKFIREHFFGKYKETLELVSDLSDDDIWRLTRGGHDLDKIYNAYHLAMQTKERPTVILAKTIKGFGLSGEGESQNIAHQQKKLSSETLKKICEKFSINLSDSEIAKLPFLTLEKDSEEYNYLHNCRKKLGGYYPVRVDKKIKLRIPSLDKFEALLNGTNDKEISTTMAFVRILNTLIKDKEIGQFIIPIVPDESRTFGMEGMFRSLGIWSHIGQLYTPEDAHQLMFYKEDVKGQIFQEGINEPGAMSLWIAAATSYVNYNLPTIPFYIYYSMFGFQRIGDLAWAAGDLRARGFLIGGTSGRTTLNGEGLQHEDGNSHTISALIPNCESYDPTFSYELAVIIRHGLKEMYEDNLDKFYYVSVMNENYQHPPMHENMKDGIIKGCYLFSKVKAKSELFVNILGSGTIFREALKAAELLKNDFNINVNLYSTTSFTKLARNGMEIKRNNMLQLNNKEEIPYITELLNNSKAKVTVAVSDYVQAFANQIREFIPHRYITLGTDGYGRSDFRVALRKFFEIDSYYITVATLYGLFKEGLIKKDIIDNAIKKYNLTIINNAPWER